jgi:hypothetical protein
MFFQQLTEPSIRVLTDPDGGFVFNQPKQN